MTYLERSLQINGGLVLGWKRRRRNIWDCKGDEVHEFSLFMAIFHIPPPHSEVASSKTGASKDNDESVIYKNVSLLIQHITYPNIYFSMLLLEFIERSLKTNYVYISGSWLIRFFKVWAFLFLK